MKDRKEELLDMELEYIDILLTEYVEKEERRTGSFAKDAKLAFSAIQKAETTVEDMALYTLLEKTGALSDPLKRLSILLMLSYEKDIRYRDTFALISGAKDRNFPTAGLALSLYALFNDDAKEREQDFLSGDGGLFYHILRDTVPGQSLTLTSPLRFRFGAVAFLSGKDILPSSAFHLAKLIVPDGRADENTKALERIMKDAGSNEDKCPAVIYVRDGERRGIGNTAANASKSPVISAELKRASEISIEMFDTGVADLTVFSALSGKPLLFTGLDVKDKDSVRAFQRALDVMKGALPFCIAAGGMRSLGAEISDPKVYEFLPALPDLNKRKAIWKEALSKIKTAKDVDIEGLSLSYDLSGDEIRRIVRGVEADLTVSGKKTATRDMIVSRVLSGSGLDFGELATRLPAAYTWDDIELSKENRALMKMVCDRYRMSRLMEDEWGLRKKNAYGNGISVLFSGPSGTGKTMSAMCMAAELGLELYRVDLSQMSSKWIGETEKNIGKVFDEAEKSRCILFFDEADALFARRTDVSTSNDKHANNETAYILQKMEEYDGLSVMATNLYQNFDAAFLRRITYTVKFENPGPEMRLSLWKKVLPKEVPVDPKIDFSVFAERFEISGSNIKSIMYASAYMAAAENKPVDAECIVKAAKYELRKLGRMVNASDFGPYGGLF